MATQKELVAFNRLLAEVEERLQAQRRLHVEYVQVLSATMKVFDEPNPEKLCGLGLTAEDVLAKLADYPFEAPAILGSIEASGLQIPGGMGRIRAALGRTSGDRWEILSHPADPFPSDPCAHNEADDVTLDLSTGALYHDRQYVNTLFRKDLSAFRVRVAAECPGVRLPPMKET